MIALSVEGSGAQPRDITRYYQTSQLNLRPALWPNMGGKPVITDSNYFHLRENKVWKPANAHAQVYMTYDPLAPL